MVKKIKLLLKNDTGQIEFDVKANQLGKNVVSMVCQAFNLREPWYFTLRYSVNGGKDTYYMLKSEKLSSQPIGKISGAIFCSICVYIYPENTVTGLITQSANEFFFETVKELIRNETLYTPPETCLLLASMAALNDYGIYNPSVHKGNYVPVERYLPQSVFDQYDLPIEAWQEKLTLFHQQMSDDYVANDRQIFPQAEYLKYCQDLDMFGVYYTEITNKNKTTLYLGLSPIGINTYKNNNKIDIFASFPYGEIKNVSQKNKKVKIKIRDQKSGDSDFCFWLRNAHEGSLLTDMIMEYRSLYIQNRKEDSELLKLLRRQSNMEQETLRKQKDLLALRSQQIAELENKMKTFTSTLHDYDGNHYDQEDYEKLKQQVHELTNHLNQLMAEKAILEEKLSKLHLADDERAKMEDELAAKTSLLDEKTEKISKLLSQFERNNEVQIDNSSVPECTQLESVVVMTAPSSSHVADSQEDVINNLQQKISKLEEKFNNDQNNKMIVYEDIRRQRDMLEQQLHQTLESQKQIELDRAHQLSLEAELNEKAHVLTAKYDTYVPKIDKLSSKLQLLVDERDELERLLSDVASSSSVASNVRNMIEHDLENKKLETLRIQNQISDLEGELAEARELLLQAENEHDTALQNEKEKNEKLEREAEYVAHLESEINRLDEYMLESESRQVPEETYLTVEMHDLKEEPQMSQSNDGIVSCASSDHLSGNQNGNQIELKVELTPSVDDMVEVNFDDNELQNLPQIEENREPAKIVPQNEFQKFIQTLENTKIESKQSSCDVIYRSNVLLGRDKYKTLKLIRANNTKKHIEAFEML